ncbi:pyruvate dehydrogenase E1 component alpha subunit [Arthrobacter stackebrandtii]|uniref:Pyruvate dehydrogenase E1 component alpha subunit n=1 Tax=Arthrobacter stackebrandtii TaxID=272161 RepID=A0ABS4YUX3_9MICC|nr:pyruvate dehydrogenase (acetyl-transferring) E1 component subunit alpha [Arthrobacter stackebrandtii]MBP2412599.1 pyruvate dehydrogenase E1 component alpha subunit [Arthrobacter stackebrandtii]PYH02338.1 pyruvate dehydrogenase (acetyl-transferring) E1 component subunit alpha [Arthrobacter stackebrandtii]
MGNAQHAASGTAGDASPIQGAPAPDAPAPGRPQAGGSAGVLQNRTVGPDEAVQLLDEHGALHHESTFSPYIEALDPEVLRGFYRDMATVRRFDAEATALQRQGELALWVPVVGQEAAQIGSGRAMKPADYAFPTYREHGVALTRGLDLADLLKLFRGISNGGWDPRETNFHLYTLVLAAQTLHAVGYAMGISRDLAADPATEPAAVVAYFGDGSSSEGDVHESMVFAASYDAPVVFFCQNNNWAISVPFEVQSKIPLVNRAGGYGIPGIRVDGNDVLAVYAVTQWALDHARNGHGPVLIEASTYRIGAHTTADDPTKYRMNAEEEFWKAKDPLARLETYLRAQGLADDEFFEQVKNDGDELAAHVRRATLALGGADIRQKFATVYAEAHPLVAEELAWFESYEASFADADTNNSQIQGGAA